MSFTLHFDSIQNGVNLHFCFFVELESLESGKRPFPKSGRAEGWVDTTRVRDCEGKERTLSVFWGRPINLPRAGFKFPQTVVAAHILSVRVFVQPLLSLSLRSSPTTTAAAALKNLLHISQNLSWKLHFTNAQNSRTVPSICYVRTSSQKGSFVTHGNFSVNLTSSNIWRVRIRTHYCTLVGQRAYHGASPPHPV